VGGGYCIGAPQAWPRQEMVLKHLLSACAEVLSRIDSAHRTLLLSDFDGTLAPIVARPELASLSQETATLLLKLSQCPMYSVAIVSGRALDDLKDRVGIPGITYAANYGMEIESPRFSLLNAAADRARSLFRQLDEDLRSALAHIPGAIVEYKGLTLSVHYRLVPERDQIDVRDIVHQLTASASYLGHVEVTDGKKVFELRPATAWDKGKTVSLLVDRLSPAGVAAVLPCFLGDDVSDEVGFDAVDKLGGISIYVGQDPSHTRAGYYLASPQEVTQFLAMLPTTRVSNS